MKLLYDTFVNFLEGLWSVLFSAWYHFNARLFFIMEVISGMERMNIKSKENWTAVVLRENNLAYIIKVETAKLK